VLVCASPTKTVFRELTDDAVRQRLLDLLQEAGMIRRYRHYSGVERWERG
jgi:hypothetical protein